jgi:hypothetical protein
MEAGFFNSQLQQEENMSPHIEYWGIPSPADEIWYCATPGEKISRADAGAEVSPRIYVSSMDAAEDDADFIPESFE